MVLVLSILVTDLSVQESNVHVAFSFYLVLKIIFWLFPFPKDHVQLRAPCHAWTRHFVHNQIKNIRYGKLLSSNLLICNIKQNTMTIETERSKQ